MTDTDKPAPVEQVKCRYCGGAGRFQIVSLVSDHAWAVCFCIRHPLAARVAELEAGLNAIMSLTGEINPSNYDHDDVMTLNNAFIETFNIARDTLRTKP